MSSVSRTLVETDACPQALCRGDTPWSMQEVTIEELLGDSRISSVVRCSCAHTGHPLALKMYHKQVMTLQDCKQVAREIGIHGCQEHSSILGLYAAFEDLDGIYLVQEYAPGGDLYKLLAEAGGHLPEAQVALQIIRPLLSALASLRAQGIVHRDIKPENILVAHDGSIRLADFGLAIDTSQEVARARVGTLDYFAPEMLSSSSDSTTERRPYGTAVDVWAAAILAYELLLGGPPFETDMKEETYHRILTEDAFLPSLWSTAAKDFLRMALIKDPSKRPTAAELALHPWLAPPVTVSMADPPKTPLR